MRLVAPRRAPALLALLAVAGAGCALLRARPERKGPYRVAVLAPATGAGRELADALRFEAAAAARDLLEAGGTPPFVLLADEELRQRVKVLPEGPCPLACLQRVGVAADADLLVQASDPFSTEATLEIHEVSAGTRLYLGSTAFLTPFGIAKEALARLGDTARRFAQEDGRPLPEAPAAGASAASAKPPAASPQASPAPAAPPSQAQAAAIEEVRRRAEEALGPGTVVAPSSPAPAPPAPGPEAGKPPPLSRQPSLPQPPAAQAPAQGKLLAVLELASSLRGTEKELLPRTYFSDRVRRLSLQRLPGARIISRENLEVIAKANHLDLEQCEGQCAVETGRKLGADLVVSGELLKVGSSFRLTLSLHDTRSGDLKGTGEAGGATADALLAATDAAIDELLAPLR